MFDVNISLSNLFYGCFRKKLEVGQLDLNAVSEYIENITDPMEKITIICEYLYSNTKYKVLFLTHKKEVILKRNFDVFKQNKYELLTFPILDKNGRLLGTLAVGNLTEFNENTEFTGLIKILANVLKKM